MRLLLSMIIAALFLGCSSQTVQETDPSNNSNDTSETTVPESTDAEATNDASPVFVIDVRSKSEWDDGHVEQAVLIPHTEIADRITEVTDDKDAKIVLYCAVGGRAGQAKTALEELGFKNVENAGGYDDVKDRF